MYLIEHKFLHVSPRNQLLVCLCWIMFSLLIMLTLLILTRLHVSIARHTHILLYITINHLIIRANINQTWEYFEHYIVLVLVYFVTTTCSGLIKKDAKSLIY